MHPFINPWIFVFVSQLVVLAVTLWTQRPSAEERRRAEAERFRSGVEAAVIQYTRRNVGPAVAAAVLREVDVAAVLDLGPKEGTQRLLGVIHPVIARIHGVIGETHAR